MSKEKSRCLFDDPDCFNCPYDECVASARDIRKQHSKEKEQFASERDREIVSAFQRGATREGLSDRYGIHTSTVGRILNSNGIYKKRRTKINENESG